MSEPIEPGLRWRPSEGSAPELNVPVHLERTLSALHVLHEALSIEEWPHAAKTVLDAISTIEYMAEQLTAEIRRREALAGMTERT